MQVELRGVDEVPLFLVLVRCHGRGTVVAGGKIAVPVVVS
jgi:hypothetical protein